ncbi:hypothetical protein C4577_01810 [Candidatus Parcubacteria bacterium]|nr:MAG: hypothetical protein C4577_01810 [Candidatus Parcubacteria bacterium]
MATEKAIAETPKEFVCGPYRYTIDFDGEASYDYSYLGVCLNRSRRIKLDPRQSDTELPQTLLHEAIHALGGAYEIKEWRGHTTDAAGNVTDKIDLMASALLQFIRVNPKLVEWLSKTR